MRSRSALRACCSLMGPSPKRFLFSLALCGIVVSKLVHLKVNLVYETTGFGTFCVFFPTFFIKDVFAVFVIAYALFDFSLSDVFLQGSRDDSRRPGSPRAAGFGSAAVSFPRYIVRFCFGVLLPIIIWLASSSELSYYLNTRQLVDWAMTGRIILDFANFASVLTGTGGNEITAGSLVGQLLIARFEYLITDRIFNKTTRRFRWLKGGRENGHVREKELVAFEIKELGKTNRNVRPYVVLALVILAGDLLLAFFRPPVRFNMSINSIPVVMLDCFEGAFGGGAAVLEGKGFLGFPYPELVQLDAGSAQHRATDWLMNEYMPSPPPHGFEYMTKESNEAWQKFAQKAMSLNNKIDTSANSSELKPPKGYHHAYNPSKVSNLHMNIHPEFTTERPVPNSVQQTLPLKDVTIRNIIVINLESTRYDMYPLYDTESYMKFAEGYRTKLSKEDYVDLNRVTPFGRKLFGERHAHGGMGGLVTHGTEAYCALTQKSLVSSTCGTSPLAMAWFQEAAGRCYNPCFPSVFKLLNREAVKGANDWRFGEWDASWLQTATTSFDRQTVEFHDMGFHEDDGTLVNKEVMESKDAKFPDIVKNESYVNWQGYRDETMLPYFREKIRKSKENNSRFFIGHITTASHLPWTLPKNWKEWKYTDLFYRNQYFNIMAYNDHWVHQLFNLLDEEGVRNETMVVVAGDHGMSAGDDNKGPDGTWNPVPNPWVNIFRIPLMFHHPQLPPMHLHANASNRDILPTVLDFILSSNSLPDSRDSKHARILEGILPTYEGQSLIRERVHKNKLGMDNYNTHLVSPGGEILVVTSTDPNNPYRLRVPLNSRRQYGLAHLQEDNDEQEILRGWTAATFFPEVEKRWGVKAREWAVKADTIARWKIEENKRRWGMFEPASKKFSEFGGFHDKKPSKSASSGSTGPGSGATKGSS